MPTTFIATGSFVPAHREANGSLELELGLDTGWIEQRTGVRSRAIADPADAVSDLATRACQAALQKLESNGFDKQAVSTLILATSTPDHLLPPSAPKVAFELGLENVGSFDLTVACCGFLHATILADALVQTTGQPVLVVAANILSRRCRTDDSGTRPIFADAAGAVIFGQHENSNSEELQHQLPCSWHSDGSGWQELMIPDGGSRSPINEQTFEQARHLMQLNNGNAVFKYAVESMKQRAIEVCDKANIAIDEIDWWIPHQANIRIIESVRRGLRIDKTKTLTTLAAFGNSSAATIPVTLDHFMTQPESPFRSGDRILMTAAAAGMTSAAVLLQLP